MLGGDTDLVRMEAAIAVLMESMRYSFSLKRACSLAKLSRSKITAGTLESAVQPSARKKSSFDGARIVDAVFGDPKTQRDETGRGRRKADRLDWDPL
jgi:hypothetical protein